MDDLYLLLEGVHMLASLHIILLHTIHNYNIKRHTLDYECF